MTGDKSESDKSFSAGLTHLVAVEAFPSDLVVSQTVQVADLFKENEIRVEEF